MTAARHKGKLKLAFIAAIFLGPLLAAWWLYFSGASLAPEGRTNVGHLFSPIVNVDEALGGTGLTTLTDGKSEGRWALVYWNDGRCGEPCEAALYRQRQSHRMLGRDMSRVARLFLHGDTAPDKVLLESGQDGLITIKNRGLAGLLDRKRPTDLEPGGLYLIDPLGNLVMYFEAGVDPGDMVGDIEHLLELSRIG